MNDGTEAGTRVSIDTKNLWKYFTSQQIWEAFECALDDKDRMLDAIKNAKKYAQELEQTVGWLTEENQKLREVLNIESQPDGE